MQKNAQKLLRASERQMQSGQLSRMSSYLPFIDFGGDNAETEVMLAVCLGGSAVCLWF